MSTLNRVLCLLGLIMACSIHHCTPIEAQVNGDETRFEIHVNVGGNPVTLPDGTVYLRDGEYTQQRGYGWDNGYPDSSLHGIGGCDFPELYDHMHILFNGSYRINAPDGTYLLTIGLADLYSNGVGQRPGSIMLGDQILLDNIDVYAMVGRDYAITYRFLVTAEEGRVLLDTISPRGVQICTVSLQSAPAVDSVSPSEPELTEILGGFEQTILNWEDNTEEDLAGYLVFRQPSAGGPMETVVDELSLMSRFIDHDVIPSAQYQYWLQAVDTYGNTSDLQGPFLATPVSRSSVELPCCEITIDPDSLALLNIDPWEDTYYSCLVAMDGVQYQASVRYRGNVLRTLSKKSHKIKFGDILYQNRKKLNLNSEMCDPALMRSGLSMDLFADMGVPTPRLWMRSLFLNDRYYGVVGDVEQLDEHFLASHNLDQDGNIYKCQDRLIALPDSADYHDHYEKETNEDDPWADLIDFIETLNNTPNEEYYETIIDIFDIEEFINYYATMIFVGDGDSIYKNFYLYHDLSNNLWQIIPWDKDLTWGITWPFDPEISWGRSLATGAYSSGNVLYYRMLNEPVIRNAYASRLFELLTERFPVEDIYSRIDSAYLLVVGDGCRDAQKWFWETNNRLYGSDDEIKNYATNREDFIMNSIHTLPREQGVYINEFMAANSSGITDEMGEFDDWIELYNPGPDPVDLSDYFLTDDLSSPIQWSFPDTTIAPYEYLIVWADNDLSQGPLHANFKLGRNGELIALHKNENPGGIAGPDDIDPEDLVFFGAQVDDVSRGRIEDGSFRWASFPMPSPGARNSILQGTPDETTDLFLNQTQLLVSPNPFRSSVQLRLNNANDKGKVCIYDIHGRLCQQLGVGQNSWVWDGIMRNGTPAPPGLYWARFSDTADLQSCSKRVLLLR